VHAKSHGLLQGELRVLDGLPKSLAQGVFARPATYPVVLRISTARARSRRSAPRLTTCVWAIAWWLASRSAASAGAAAVASRAIACTGRT